MEYQTGHAVPAMIQRVPKAILFDLDCTLTDRAATLSRYASMFVQRFASRLKDPDRNEVLARYAEVDGLGYRARSECWQHLIATLRWREPPSTRELGLLWRRWGPPCTAPATDALPVLGALARRGYALGIVTNGPAATQSRKLETLGVRNAVNVVLISDAVGVRKPEPTIFTLACERLGVAPGDAWHVGDHPETDVFGARRAGLTEVWVRLGRSWENGMPAPARQVDRLGDLLEMLP